MSIAEMFKYCPDAIHLDGFPHSPFSSKLFRGLGQEESLAQYGKPDEQGKMIVIPSFPQEYIQQRQQFFQRLGRSHHMRKSVFERTFPKRKPRKYNAEEFIGFCSEVRQTLADARQELFRLRGIPEKKGILDRIRRFEEAYGKQCCTLEQLDNMNTFLINTDNGSIEGWRTPGRESGHQTSYVKELD